MRARWRAGGRSRAWLAAGAALVALAGPAASAAELDGSLYLSAGTSDTDGAETDLLDQRARFTLRQELTDYVTVRLGYRFLDLSSDTEGGDFDRRTREPSVELVYSHPEVYGSLTYFDRSTTGLVGDRLDVESLVGTLSWEVLDSTTLSARFRDESNVVDSSVLGLGTDTRQLDLEAVYTGSAWSGSYSYETWDAENTRTGLDLSRESHEARLDAGHNLLGGALWLGLTGWGRLSDQTRELAGGVLADPVPARAGLFAIDPSPESSTLEPLPGLVDADTTTPTAPRVEIGGASTFRNVGVDLGLTRPVSRLEISVDSPSGPSLAWEVYRSRDNLLWERVDGVVVEWDGALLRYTLSFPAAEDRFFKAVNVSVNSQPQVAVTEVRALREVDGGGIEDGETTLYRADATARFEPHQRVSGTVGFGISKDEGLAGSVLRRDFRDTHANALLTVRLPGHLAWTNSYRYLDFEDRVEPVLLRTEEITVSRLRWEPLDTLSADLSWQQREEQDEERPVRDTTTLRLAVTAELLPDLELESVLEESELVDAFFGSDRTVSAWRQRLDARLTDSLRVTGGYSLVRYEDAAGNVLLERTDLDLRTTWRATPYLTLTGDWTVGEDQLRDSLRQSYALSYAPGSKLTLTAAYQELSDDGLRETSTSSAAVNYRLNPRFRLFANHTRSETATEELASTRIDSFRLGLSVLF